MRCAKDSRCAAVGLKTLTDWIGRTAHTASSWVSAWTPEPSPGGRAVLARHVFRRDAARRPGADGGDVAAFHHRQELAGPAVAVEDRRLDGRHPVLGWILRIARDELHPERAHGGEISRHDVDHTGRVGDADGRPERHVGLALGEIAERLLDRLDRVLHRQDRGDFLAV